MDAYSSGEDLVIKTRKPYTITKQRERWTDEEHNRFLEALKLYGRAWQRIEEHIGTKTAVQIRSHAQKFFTKLEKEALVKGVPIGQALDIEIPPPRPKRKPSNPYPRKTGVGRPTQQVGAKDGKSSTSGSSLCTGKQILDLESKPLPEKPGGDERLGPAKENQDENNCSEIFSLFQEAPCTSLSSANKNSTSTTVLPRNGYTYWEFVPLTKEVSSKDETNESYVTVEPNGHQNLVKLDAKQMIQDNGTSGTSNFKNSNPSLEKSILFQKTDEISENGNFRGLPSNDMHATQSCPRHVPVHVLDGSLGMSTQNVSPNMPHQESICHQMGGIHGHPNLFTYLGASATTEHNINASSSSIHQSFPPFHPLFTPLCNNQNDNRSDLHVSSTFSSLILSTLVQNPAAHAAASFAATFWPCENMEPSADSPPGTFGGFLSRQMNPAPSMAAIAAATVAAATAWWAAHGLLPLCTPFRTDFNCTPASAIATPMDAGLTAAGNNDKRENTLDDLPLQNQRPDPEYSEAQQEQHSASKLDSEESEGGKPKTGLSAADNERAAAVTDDLDKTKSRKQVDRSSCGSNTASSSEVETDALEKHEKGEEELKEPDVSHPDSDSNNRRGRSFSSANDSWKEVSEEGRLAFQALFSREVLPQSFSPSHDMKNKGYQKKNIEKDKQNADEKVEDSSQLDLSGKTWGTCSSTQVVENNASFRIRNDGEDGILTMELGYGKLKPRRTGFKPYKRCSVEAKESGVGSASSCQGEEKGPKRLRLEGEAST